MRLRLLGILTISLLTVALVSPAFAQVTPVDVIIGVTDGMLDHVHLLVQSLGGTVRGKWVFISALHVTNLPPQALEALQRNPNVRYVETTGTVYALGKTPSPPGKTPPPQPAEELPWGVDRIDANLAWASSTGDGVKVAVLDTGIDNSHPDLDGNVKGGVSVVGPITSTNPKDWKDKNGHGTHVAGIIAAENNEIGVVGVAPKASLYAVKVLNNAGVGSWADVIDGIEWSIQNGMQVISMSLGGSSYSQALEEACNAAYAAGLVLVAAAGNSGDGNPDTNEVLYPAAFGSVIAVAATDQGDAAPYWSSSGPNVELAAPGVSVKSTWIDGTYETLSGTSMATPHVSGTVALVWAKNSTLTNEGVRALLQTTADNLGSPGRDNVYGYGLVDAKESTLADSLL